MNELRPRIGHVNEFGATPPTILHGGVKLIWSLMLDVRNVACDVFSLPM